MRFQSCVHQPHCFHSRLQPILPFSHLSSGSANRWDGLLTFQTDLHATSLRHPMRVEFLLHSSNLEPGPFRWPWRWPCPPCPCLTGESQEPAQVDQCPELCIYGSHRHVWGIAWSHFLSGLAKKAPSFFLATQVVFKKKRRSP